MSLHSVKPRIPHLLALVALTGLTAAGAAARPSQTTTRTYFVLGQRLVAVPAHRTTVRGAVSSCSRGPAPGREARPAHVRAQGHAAPGGLARRRHGHRRFRCAVRRGHARGAHGADRAARLHRLVGAGSPLRAPAGRGPHSFSEALSGSRPDAADRSSRHHAPEGEAAQVPPAEARPPSPATRKLQQRLAYLGFLPARTSTAKRGRRRRWRRSASRSGPASAATAYRAWPPWTLSPTAKRPTPIRAGTGRRVEVLLDRQLTLLIDGNRVVATIPASTGKGVNATPPGSFRVFRKEVMSWSYLFQVWLPWASYFYGGIAFHEYADVPTQAASHGCVRTPRYWSQQLYHFTPIGTPSGSSADRSRRGHDAALRFPCGRDRRRAEAVAREPCVVAAPRVGDPELGSRSDAPTGPAPAHRRDLAGLDRRRSSASSSGRRSQRWKYGLHSSSCSS